MSVTDVVTLRTAAQTQQHDSIMKLYQFNPSFFLVKPQGIPCSVPGCQVKIPQPKPKSSSEYIKQDLFLCEIHRTKMANLVSERCRRESVFVSVASYKHEDFNGYTYLIGELEKAFTHLTKKQATGNVPSNLLLAEVCLNARNFLIITNALLNPNGDNIGCTLPPFFEMFDRILSALPALLERLVAALREIVDIILNFFGIIYAWVFLGNPGSQVGASAGLILGGVVGGGFVTVLGAVLWAVFGLIAGKLIGDGIYDWYEERQQADRQIQRVREYQEFVRQIFGQASPPLPRYHMPANARGDIALRPEYAAIDSP